MKPSLKIAVYTIALNEEKHVKRWFDSARDADLLLIADTGSTDKTRFVAKSLGITVHEVEVKPWRFDVARNASLALIPEDYDICIQLDMDEVLPKGWRRVVEEAFIQGNNWPLYKEVTSRFEDGTVRAFYMHFRIHPRKGFFWKYPIHEVLTHAPEVVVVRKEIDLEVDHLQDPSKSRHSYLNLLELAVNEEPKDWRMNHYLNREYFYQKKWIAVLQTAYVCKEIEGGWDVERASTYMWASEAALNLKFPGLAEYWAKLATEAAPGFYEVWHWRAHVAHLNEKWFECLKFASEILYLNRQTHHLVKPAVWEWWGYDLIALASHKIGNHSEAVSYGEKASYANQDMRLIKNLDFYKKALVNQIQENSVSLSKAQKLRDFPTILVITIEPAAERRQKLVVQFDSLNLSGYEFIYGEIASNREDKQAVQNAILQSHLKAIKYFHEETELEWIVIFEDDVNFNLVEHWPFTWREKFESLKSVEFDIYQMCIMANRPEWLQTGLHKRRQGFEWSSAAYLLSRSSAERILQKTIDHNQACESNLFDAFATYSEALLVCDTDNEDAFHFNYVNSFKTSFDKALSEMKKRTGS